MPSSSPAPLPSRLFDDKVALDAKYQYNGTQGGDKWRCKMKGYFISKAPGLKALLLLSERADMTVVDPAMLDEWCTDPSGRRRISRADVETMSTAVWGFLNTCLSGPAERVFQHAADLAGFDGWRRVMRIIDQGRAVHLEECRARVRTVTQRVIKRLEDIPIGVADFDKDFQDYADAGGDRPKDQLLKSDLLAVLPTEIRDDLLWHATREDNSYEQFRDYVVVQAARVLQNRRKLPLHYTGPEFVQAVDEQQHGDYRPGAQSDDELDELLAAVEQVLLFQPLPEGQEQPVEHHVPARRTLLLAVQAVAHFDERLVALGEELEDSL